MKAITHHWNRRQFLSGGALSLAALAAETAFPQSSLLAATVEKPKKDPYHGLKVGVASYSLRHFPLKETIAMTQKLGVNYITLKDMHLPFNSTTEERKAARKLIQDAGLVLMGCGVVYMKNDEAQIRSYFDYAKDAAMPTIVCSPNPDALDQVEKMVKEYDIKAAIHNHGPGDTHYPSPLDVMNLVKDRDKRMGVCIDIGHTIRIGQDPVEVTRQCAGRLYDFHIKDVTAADPKGKGIAVGRGVIDIVGLFRTLIELKFEGHVALEYEMEAEAPLPGMTESFAYMRGVLAALQ